MKEQVSQKKKGNILQTSMYLAVLVGLTAFLIFSVLAAISFGNADLSLKDVYSVIAYKLFHIKSLSSYGEGAIHDVVWLIRLPRVLLALGVGMALSTCGVVMQAIVQNPLADPYVLGISSGASLGATVAIMFGIGGFLGENSVGMTAFAGAMLTSFAVLAIANMGGKATSAKLILAGMAVSAVCSAFSNFVIYITNDKNASTEVMKWSMGSLAGASWSRVDVMLPITIICVVIFWTQYRNLNLMLLGDEVSITLGTDLHRLRTIYLIIASVMVGFAVYCAGVIGFVGLVIPHVVRILFGTDHRRLLPLSALLGASFLIWCDVACRVILKNSDRCTGFHYWCALLYLSAGKKILWIWRQQGMKITTQDIQIGFHARQILKGISIESQDKELVGILGPNGSGKSTLLKCIYRILKPDAGAVYLDGEELHSMSVKSSAKKMAVVAQHNYYNFDFTVREVVMMGRAPHKKTLERDNARDYQIVDEALKTVQMEEFADRTFSTLSGGEQQRVILARALAQQTPALILDEPTNHLDITHQIMLMELVKKLNITVISAIHDLNIAAAYCDKIYVLKDGVLEAYGTPQEVLTPELIRRIYRVESEIVYDSHGKMHILFL